MLINIAEDSKVDIYNTSNYENEMVKKSPLPKNLNRVISYSTFDAK